MAWSSGTVLFFENFHVHLDFKGRFFAVQALAHVLMFGASLANSLATRRGAVAQSGRLSFGSLLAYQRRQSATRHCTGGLSVLKAASASWHHAINTQGMAQMYAKQCRQSKAENDARPVLRQP